MNELSTADGIAFLCDLDGIIKVVIRDELGFADHNFIGKSIKTIFDDASLEKAEAFLETLRVQHAAFGWELNIQLDDAIRTLFLAGGVAEDRLLIVGAKSRSNVARYYDELMRINNEQMNNLRAALKDQSLQARQQELQAREQVERDNRLYDEMTRLNNELANLQRELAKKNFELERLNQLKNQFIGMAAHDLRTPLNVIIGYSNFLSADLVDIIDQEHLEFIDAIESSSRFMFGLISNLLDINIIESGRLELEPQLTDLNALIEHNIKLNRVLAEQRQIKIIFEGAPSLPRIRIDANKIEQVLNNLISNALKFSRSNSSVTVRLLNETTNILLTVTDEGQGIPANELDKLFKPFGRTSVRSIDGERSTGLGLAIVKNIINGHQGSIWVESEVGKGTTFFISLPIR